MRLEKPHSLSYQDMTRQKVPSITLVWSMWKTEVMDGTFVRVMSWYDNEWGFSSRMADTAVAFGKLI